MSAGRVQSVAVRLIVEREKEVNGFSSVSSYKVVANFITEDKEVFKSELKNKFTTRDDAYNFLEKCKNSVFTISSIDKKPAKKSPSPPFITSTLQQEASRKLGFSVSKTMMIAQKLYESGKITYMRTDSVNLSEDAIISANQEINNLYGQEYAKKRVYNKKTKEAQEEHEAKRP